MVIGATGGIGSAFADHLENDPRSGSVLRFSRSSTPSCDLTDESSIEAVFEGLNSPLHLIIDATGFLSDDTIKPEKSLRSLNAENLLHLYHLNAVGPALIMKHAAKHLPRNERSIFATLSARVGSISDNRLGGWYAYRASKAALNMLLKSASVEIARNRPEAVLVSLHPGTVATPLSEPFASDRERLTPEQSASDMLGVLDGLGPDESGSFWDYKGKRIEW